MRHIRCSIATIVLLVGCSRDNAASNGNLDFQAQGKRRFDRDGKVPSVEIGDLRITVATPNGFALINDDAPQVRQRVRETTPPQNDLHAIFIEQIDLARVLDGKAPKLRRLVSVQSDRRLTNQVVTSEIWNGVKQSLTGKDVTATMVRNREIVNNNLRGLEVQIDKMTLIDFEESSRDTFVLIGLVKAASTDDDVEYPIRVNAVASRLLQGKIVIVAASSECDTRDDIAWAKQVALECAESSR